MDLTYIVVDIETSGLVSGKHSILSIGACVPFTREEFYVELKPATRNHDPASLKVAGLSLNELRKTGKPPTAALVEFEQWISKVSRGNNAVFTAFPAAFDWPFVSRYFYKYLNRNPFENRKSDGSIDRRVLDMKSLFAGKLGLGIDEATREKLFEVFKPSSPHSHHALDDARGYAECLEKLLTRDALDSRSRPTDEKEKRLELAHQTRQFLKIRRLPLGETSFISRKTPLKSGRN